MCVASQIFPSPQPSFGHEVGLHSPASQTSVALQFWFAQDLVQVCPFWSGTPYEMLALPKAHEGHITDAKPGDLVAVGRALRDCLDKLRTRVDDLAYNLVFHTLPHHHDDEFHWHVHVLPRVASVVGFEQGTGVLINIVAPEDAAATLR